MHNTVRGKVTDLRSAQKLQRALSETLNHAPVLTCHTHTGTPKPLLKYREPATSEMLGLDTRGTIAVLRTCN